MKRARLFFASALMLLAGAALGSFQFGGRYGEPDYSFPGDREKPRQVEHPRRAEDVGLVQVELAHQEPFQLDRRAQLDLEPDGRPAGSAIIVLPLTE